jgi:RNA polymerase sigma factor (sigma-70 family)
MSPLAVSLRFLQTQPDARLVELARSGHERAFEALVRRYRGPLLAYCRRVAPRGTSPEDILQQGLLQAWRALSSGADVRDARAWLYRIVHNVAVTTLRSSGELSDGIVAHHAAPAVEQVVEQRMAARDALAGLAALPDLQRQVMVSTALDGRTHEEIAAALGVTSGSVRGLIYRARSTLRAAAAALIPAPVIDWAVGDAGSASAGLAGAGAGAGSAGLGALIVKGGAIVAVGAIAGTTAIVVAHHGRSGGHRDHLQAAVSPGDGRPATSPATNASGRTGAARLVVASTVAAAGPARRRQGGAGASAPQHLSGHRRDRFGQSGSSSSTGQGSVGGAQSGSSGTDGHHRGQAPVTGSDGGGSGDGAGSRPGSGSSGSGSSGSGSSGSGSGGGVGSNDVGGSSGGGIGDQHAATVGSGGGDRQAASSSALPGGSDGQFGGSSNGG